MSTSQEDLPSSPESEVETPSSQQQQTSSTLNILTPPSQSQTQLRTNMPISPTGLNGANSNGKRPINTISNGADEGDSLSDTMNPALQPTSSQAQANGATSKPRAAQGQPQPPADFPQKVHERSGYRWDREEDAPGYAWLNKKAVEEYSRALDGMVGREGGVVGARYPDPFEMVEKERAVSESMKQT